MQIPGVRDKWMKLAQAKSLGKEPLSRQLLYLARFKASPTMQSTQRGGHFIFLSSFLPPLFHLNSTCRQQKTSMIFAGLFSRSISISCLRIEVLCEENSPCQQNQVFHKWLPEWSSFLIPSADRQCFARQKALGEDTRVPIVFPGAVL